MTSVYASFRGTRTTGIHHTNRYEGIVTKIHATQLSPAAAFEYESTTHPGVLHSVNLRLIIKLVRQAVDILHENQLIICSDAVALEEKCQTIAETSTADCVIGVWDDVDKDIVFN